MKKGLKIAGIVIAALLVLLLVLPIAFKGKIKDVVVREGNKMLNAQFDIGSVNISLIRNFPKATISVNDFALWGIGDFAQDTLASVDRLSLTVNLGSIFSGSGFEVSQVSVNGAGIKAVVLEDGRPNWDIMKSSGEAEETADDDGESSDFNIQLRKLTIDRVNVVYDDRQGGMYAALNDISVTASGDLGAARTTLKIKTGVEALTFRSGGVPLLSKVKVGLQANIDADLEQMQFTFSDNSIALNAIRASVEGMFGMPDEGVYDMDVRLNTEKIGFKDILSLIPAIYAKEFASLQASGDVVLTAWAKGRMAGDNLPAFEASLQVTDGQFRYPALPKSVDNIRVAASAKNPGGHADGTTVAVQPLQFSLAGNPFTVGLNLSTPVSDPAFAVTAKGKIDLGMVKEVYPLEDMELNGVFTADLDLKGRMSYIEKELYDQFQASGTLQVNDMRVEIKDMPDVTIARSLFTFTPKYLQLSETTVGIGRSDITADSRLENYMAFALKGETIKGTLNVRSSLLDLNELMGEGETTEETLSAPATEEESAMAAFEVPKNIDFDMNVALAKVYFDNLQLDDVKGKIVIGGGKLDMSNLSLNTLQGAVVANGYYSTAADPKRPELNASFRMDGLSFSETFEKFVTIQKLAPVFEGLRGNFSGLARIETRMDSLMNVDFNTLNGNGNLTTDNVSLSGIKAFDAIADAVKRPDLKNIQVRDLDLQFTIANGRVSTQPFDIKIGSDMNLNLTGSTGIDQTIDYTGKLKLPASAGVASQLTTVDLKIGGTSSSPNVSVDMAGMAQQAIQSATDMARDEALDRIGSALGVDISNAEKQRETLIEQAQKAGQQLVDEAQKQADRLVEQANNALAKAAAKTAGDALVKEAQKQADALVAKATEEGDKLVEKAKAGQE